MFEEMELSLEEIDKIIQITEEEVSFHFLNFLRTFLYHLLFYSLGPLFSIPIIFLFEGCKTNLIKNMAFFGF
jgi:hypothetical protein